METEPQIVDARGLKCPLPVLKLEKQMGEAAPGVVLVVWATDPMAKVDIPLFCRQNGHDYTQDEDGGVFRFTVTAKGSAA